MALTPLKMRLSTLARRSLRGAQRSSNGARPRLVLFAPPARPLSTAAKARFTLPAPQELLVLDQYNIKYLDIPVSEFGADRALPTIVFIHGSPGSFQDFKYMVPLLQGHARIVAVNLPGNGGSTVLNSSDYYERVRAINLAHAARETIAQLCGQDEHVFVVGHSFGGHATINVIALNELETDSRRKFSTRGFALLASAGLQPHKALQFGNIELLWRMLQSKLPFAEACAQAMTRHLYTKIWRFPARESTDYYVAGLARCASTDFSVINDHVAKIAHIPSFFAYAQDDAYIQEHIFEELSRACKSGPRFAFESGGHNIQKTKAQFLTQQILEWTTAVIAGDVRTCDRNPVLIKGE